MGRYSPALVRGLVALTVVTLLAACGSARNTTDPTVPNHVDTCIESGGCGTYETPPTHTDACTDSGGCGTSTSETGGTSSTASTGTSDCEESGGCGTFTTVPTDTGASAAAFSGCAESGGCYAYLYRDPDGNIFICTDLLVGRVPVKSGVDRADAASSVSSTTVSTSTGDTTTTAAPSRLVLRPRCASGGARILARGVSLADLSNVITSEDGKSAWTTSTVRLHGHVEDGTFVSDG
jgi:hypothetical protein